MTLRFWTIARNFYVVAHLVSLLSKWACTQFIGILIDILKQNKIIL